MASVVVIHAADDTLPARALAEKLRQSQLNVIIERQGEELRNAIRNAVVTIALWSPRSNTQAELIDEVTAARSMGHVIHAGMQSAAAPEQFRGEQMVNLTGWRGEDDFPAWRELAHLVTSKAGVAPLPEPGPRPASGFFQPGRAADAAPAPQQPRPAQQQRPPQAAPQQARSQPQAAQRPAPEPRPIPRDDEPKKDGNGLVIGVIAIAALAVLGGGAYFFMTQQGGQSGAAWEQVDRNDPDALRAFIENASGDARTEAQAALRALENSAYEEARAAGTIEALQSFLDDFPNSEHSIAARGRIAELQSLPPTPVEGEAPLGELPPTDPNAPAVDPDLVPPNATAPDAGGAPVPLTPAPADNEPLPEPGTETPTN
ncbi:TIR domain-containing protein [Vitreimonas flagellata]|uniref:TIR domain-containing protein n=1 Tax=Vitreimonas flagellata TaxID=2560861 RepID=UPI00107586A3|nr:TIR domain-containing protein [Vitreimonas flagellata]